MKQLLTTLIMLLSLPLCSFAQGWNESEYKQIESNIRTPQFPDRTFAITQFGAKVKASAAVNQKAINKAIATCSAKGGGTVVVPKGTWNTGAIRMKKIGRAHV